MITVACKPPHENARAITETGFPFLGFSGPNSPLESFGISIDPEMAVIPARELSPPTISGNKPITNVRQASWYFLNDVRFVKGARIRTWEILVIQDGRAKTESDNVDVIADRFMARLGKLGVEKPKTRPTKREITLLNPWSDDASRTKSIRIVREEMSKVGDVSFVLVLLNNQDSVIYSAIKVGKNEFWLFSPMSLIVLCTEIWRCGIGDPYSLYAG